MPFRMFRAYNDSKKLSVGVPNSNESLALENSIPFFTRNSSPLR